MRDLWLLTCDKHCEVRPKDSTWRLKRDFAAQKEEFNRTQEKTPVKSGE